jgi:hypothetical protein
LLINLINHSRDFRSKLKIAYTIAVHPDWADDSITPYIKDMEVKVMRFNLCDITYCRTILPVSSSNEGTNSKRIKKMRELLSFVGKGLTTDAALRKTSSLQKEVEEAIEQDYYLACRFRNYGIALKYIKELMSSPAWLEMWDARLIDAKRINTDNRTAKKRPSVGILTQCMFCYRFHHQDTKGRNSLSKYCPDHENDFNNWRDELKKETNFKQSKVYRDGFYRYENFETE